MTDQGRGYGTAPWGHGDPNQGAPYPGSVGYQHAPGWGDPQTEDPYGTGRQPVYPGQQQAPQPQQPMHPYPQQAPQPQQPMRPYPPQPYPRQAYPQQARPAPAPGPMLGPDGIDWEAEAAALDAQAEAPVYAGGEGHGTHEEFPEGGHDAGSHDGGDHDTGGFFAGHEDGYDDEEEGYQPFLAAEDDSRSGERRRKQQGRSERKRSGVACLGISLLLVAGVAAGGYYGYGFYQKHFGPAPDYAGAGINGTVTVTIPKGAVGWDMANALKTVGVVKSAQAFVDAYNKNAKAASIQPGSYTMHLQMSGTAAVAFLVDANGGDALIIPEGLRATDIYPRIDAKLGLPAGSTAAAAKADVGKLGLPAYANGNIEGFLWPTRYSVAKGMTPDDLLKQMVANTVEKFQSLQMDAGASGAKLTTGYQVLIEASILQAEGNNSQDFGKIARVLNNRLNSTATQGKLGLDTTLQYFLNSKTFTNKQKDSITSGYNTYVSKGLPPGPISNPGDAAIEAVLNPTPGGWFYFIAMNQNDTRFATTFDEFKTYVKQYCTDHHQGFDATAGQCN
ncbi:UPF0755 protein [Streptacidiphilus sp. MAP12-16]|uniref:endolytic transglycosylase MltG n=1 Tax=Streptacidiphilus sp. MAP12-16 TaxID=3156300 RepID=UPI003514BBB1